MLPPLRGDELRDGVLGEDGELLSDGDELACAAPEGSGRAGVRKEDGGEVLGAREGRTRREGENQRKQGRGEGGDDERGERAGRLVLVR